MDAAYDENQVLLLEFFHSRDIRLRNKIVENNLGLVRAIAYKMAHLCKLPLDDLIQIGSYGLIKAVERFNPHKKIKLSSFAIPFINGNILQYLRDKEKIVRVPRRLHEVYHKIKKNAEVYAISYSQSAKQLNIDLKLAEEASIACGFYHNELPTHLQTAANITEEIPYERLEVAELLIINLFYFEEQSIKEIAIQMNMTSTQVIDCRNCAIKKLRTWMLDTQHCPKCDSTDIVRNGKRGHKQSFLCKSCNHQFVDNPSPKGRKGYDTSLRIKVLEAINEGKSFHWCETYLGIDHSTAHYWSKKYNNSQNTPNKYLSKKTMMRPHQQWLTIGKFNALADWLTKNYPESSQLEATLDLLNKSMQQLIVSNEDKA